jgi:hypothetical protein
MAGGGKRNARDIRGMGIRRGNQVKLLATSTVQTYSASNVSTDRTFNADSVAVAELADIVGTLIADLRDQGLVI